MLHQSGLSMQAIVRNVADVLFIFNSNNRRLWINQRHENIEIIEELIAYHKRNRAIDGEFTFAGSITFAIYDNSTYLMDGQHRIAMWERLYSEGFRDVFDSFVIVETHYCHSYNKVTNIYEQCNRHNENLRVTARPIISRQESRIGPPITSNTERTNYFNRSSIHEQEETKRKQLIGLLEQRFPIQKTASAMGNRVDHNDPKCNFTNFVNQLSNARIIEQVPNIETLFNSILEFNDFLHVKMLRSKKSPVWINNSKNGCYLCAKDDREGLSFIEYWHKHYR